MGIDFTLGDVTIERFRGIRHLELPLPQAVPTYLVGPNNAGKSTVLGALALALRGGGFHAFAPQPHDFFHDVDKSIASDFLIQIGFVAAHPDSLPAVQGVGNPVLVHGIRVHGRRNRRGQLEHRHVLYDEAAKAITLSPRTALKGQVKERFKEHDLGWRQYYARLDDIRESLPDVWLLTPDNLGRSLYAWQTGPLQRLAKLLRERFLQSEWTFDYEGQPRSMPATLEAAHRFFRSCV